MRTGLVFIVVAAAVPSLAMAQAAKPPPAPPPKTVGEVVVTGQTAAPVQTSIDRRSYGVATDLQAQTGAIADALRHIPSVEVDVQGNVSLRGDPNVTILIDGKPSSLFVGDNRAQALQQLPANTIERVEVMTSPSAEFTAGGSGGVINLITKTAKGAGLTGSARVVAGDGDRAGASANAGYNSKRLTFTGDLGFRQDTQKGEIAQHRLQLDPASAGFEAVDQDQVNHIKADNLNGRASLDYDVTPRTRLGVEARANVTDFHAQNASQYATTLERGDEAMGGTPASFERLSQVHQTRAVADVSTNLRYRFAGGGELTVSLSHEGVNDARVRSGQTLDQIPAAPEAFDQQRINNRLQQTELKGDFTQPLANQAKLKLGFDLELDDNAYRNRGFTGDATGLQPDAALTNLFQFNQILGAVYASYERPFGDLTVLAGLRVEDVRLDLDQVTLGQTVRQDYVGAYPSLHLAWKLNDSQQLTASYSHRVQRPEPGEFNSFRFLLDPLTYRAGNPYLKPQQTQSLEAGYEYRHGSAMLLATLYYRDTRDGVADVQRPLGGGVYLLERNNIAQSRAGGLELVANGRLSSTLTYSLSGNLAWSEMDSLGPTFAPTRSLASAYGRANLSWQPGANDLFQLNGFVNGKRLTPQGYAEPSMAIDLGYRHKFNDRLALVVTAQNLLDSFLLRQVIDTPVLQDVTTTRFDLRQLRVALTWTFGGGRQRDPGFDFQTGASPPQ